MRERIGAGVVAVAVAVGGCGADGGSGPAGEAEATSTAWEHIDDIVYVLPEELPGGWSLHVATERTGRPRSEWTDHIEVLTDESGEGFLVLSSGLTDDTATDSRPGAIEDVPSEAFSYLFAFLGGSDPSLSAARSVAWVDSGVAMSVAHVSPGPDDALIERVANDLARTGGFDFALPPSVFDAGFAPMGSSPGSTDDVSDYTVSWAPEALVGEDREAAVDAPDDGPRIYLNVGARFYAQIGEAPDADANSAAVVEDGDTLGLEFLLSGTRIAIGGRAVSEEQLRAFASSLEERDHEAWRSELGERLLVDEPDS